MADTVELKKDNRREWRWRYKASNGQILADSGEGYRNKQDALDAMERVTGTEHANVTPRFTVVTVTT